MRYRARVEYDGTDFAGFAVQPGKRTVQGELERVLAQVSADGRNGRVEAPDEQTLECTPAGR